MRPLSTTRIWSGPTAACVSGGMKPDSDNWAARKFTPDSWGYLGSSGVPEPPPSAEALTGGGHCATAAESGSSRRCRRSANNFGLRYFRSELGSTPSGGTNVASRAMISATLTVTPAWPCQSPLADWPSAAALGGIRRNTMTARSEDKNRARRHAVRRRNRGLTDALTRRRGLEHIGTRF